MYKDYYVSVIVAAAGMSNRMGSKVNKQFLAIGNKPVLAHTLSKFENCSYVDEVILVAREDEVDYCRKEIVNKYGYKKVKNIIRGGEERQDSIYNGILALNNKTDIVLTHDGARPFIKDEHIKKGIEGVVKHDACVIGVPVKDTMKVVGEDSDKVHHTPKRSLVWAAQTPQCFWLDTLKKGYEYAQEEGIVATDDSSLVEKMGQEITMIKGSYDNIKITTPEDLIIAESLLRDLDTIKERIGFIAK